MQSNGFETEKIRERKWWGVIIGAIKCKPGLRGELFRDK
jgi:hypothetical protein